LPRDEIARVKYFTARIRPLPHDPGAPTRQAIYLRALATRPELEIIYGHFIKKQIWAPLAVGDYGATSDPWGRRIHRRLGKALKNTSLVKLKPDRAPLLRVWKTEEKGSDVNLASQLLADGFDGNYELAVVVSNDADLEWPIRYVREHLSKPVGTLNPHQRRNLRLAPRRMPPGSFYKRIRTGALSSSQLPERLSDAEGAIHPPPSWGSPKKR